MYTWWVTRLVKSSWYIATKLYVFPFSTCLRSNVASFFNYSFLPISLSLAAFKHVCTDADDDDALLDS